MSVSYGSAGCEKHDPDRGRVTINHLAVDHLYASLNQDEPDKTRCMRSTTTDADVIIVGCGPVGVMAALRSAQRGLSVIALDRDPDLYPFPRAIGMDDEVQRLFQNAGLTDQLKEWSTRMMGAEFLDANGVRVVGMELPPDFRGPSGHYPMVSFDQPSVEQFLRAAAIKAGVDVRLGVEVTAVTSDQPTSDASVTLADGSILRARWVIGADGASSTVRRLIGVTLEDQGFDEPWLVVDTTKLDPGLALSPLAQQHCNPERVVTVVPGHGTRRRWEFQLREGETREEMLEPSRIAELLKPWGTPDQLHVDRAAVYRFHAAVADTFRRGNVFLVGDAAHQMPPFNGQGMCTGMRDADNLTWKLAHVANGLAGDALLDTYDSERRPHAAGQVEHSADAGRLINAIAEGGAHSYESGYGGGRSFPHLEAGLVDGSHPRTGHPFPQPLVAGTLFDERLGDGWALVGATTPVLGLWATIGARAVATDPDAFPGLLDDGVVIIVRPDRYVAAVTTDLDMTTKRLFANLR